jgi:hypothetical protein
MCSRNSQAATSANAATTRDGATPSAAGTAATSPTAWAKAAIANITRASDWRYSPSGWCRRFAATGCSPRRASANPAKAGASINAATTTMPASGGPSKASARGSPISAIGGNTAPSASAEAVSTAHRSAPNIAGRANRLSRASAIIVADGADQTLATLLVVSAKAGTHSGHGYRPSPV